MIDGVEVLNTYYHDAVNWLGVVFTLVAIISFIAFLIFAAHQKSKSVTCMLLALAIISTILVGTLGITKIPTYDVVISDTVSFNELYEKYDIINQKGKIFVIRER